MVTFLMYLSILTYYMGLESCMNVYMHLNLVPWSKSPKSQGTGKGLNLRHCVMWGPLGGGGGVTYIVNIIWYL